MPSTPWLVGTPSTAPSRRHSCAPKRSRTRCPRRARPAQPRQRSKERTLLSSRSRVEGTSAQERWRMGICRDTLHISVRRAFPIFLSVVLAASLAGIGLLGATPPVRPAAAVPCKTLLGCGEDLAWALDLEDKIADNIWDGQVYEIDYAPGLPRTREN